MVFTLNQISTKVNASLSALKLYTFLLFGCFFLCLGLNFASAQKAKGKVELTAGIEIRALVPVSFFTPDPVELQEPNNNFVAEYSHKTGMGFGGIIRVNFTKLLNLETGLYYTRRKLEYKIDDPSVGYSATTPMRTIGYEIPIKGLVYIQMADRVFMDVALGVSADFFASDTEVADPYYDILTFKKSWIKAAVTGDLGVEYRTDESGYFYLGATFHQPFGDILATQVNYKRDATPPAYFQNGSIDGTYFSIDFRYFFPPQKPKKNKVKYTKPDWKNL